MIAVSIRQRGRWKLVTTAILEGDITVEFIFNKVLFKDIIGSYLIELYDYTNKRFWSENMGNWIGKFGIFFIVVGVVGAFVELNGIDWATYGSAKKMVNNNNLEYMGQVALYGGMIKNAILSVISGLAVGALFVGIGTLIDIGRERNDLIRANNGYTRSE
ncbi:hypothetical protein ACFQWC_14350 [Rossellomorea sp. GCM10028870]|uniref:hypothetical protein n=1 Tax=Rossellomorea sp. GCM10028870 TaxID=3273426 RepID=UPI00361C7D5B